MLAAGVLAAGCLMPWSPAEAGPWLVPDWAGREPAFPPGSLYWRTGQYPNCPVLFRTVITVRDEPVALAGLQVKASSFAHVFLNGRQIAAVEPKDAEGLATLDVELPGR